MLRFFRIIFNPLLIYLAIATLECIPYVQDKTVLHEMPKVGDNIRAPNSVSVYYYDGKAKYLYSSGECFFELGNPLYETPPDKGGIKTFEKRIIDSIPLLGDMCGEGKVPMIGNRKKVTTVERYSSTNYLLDNFSDISHLLCYIVWSFSLMVYFRKRKHLYWIVFGICFAGGGILEFVQKYFIVGRNASVEDQVLNCVGAAIGILLFWIARKTKWAKHIEG